jgi:hypothetical protein
VITLAEVSRKTENGQSHGFKLAFIRLGVRQVHAQPFFKLMGGLRQESGQ